MTCTEAHRDGTALGCIDLIAVDPDLPGRGIGTSLVTAALRHYGRHGRRVVVGTQAKNVASVNLYLRNGFRLASSQITLTRHR